MSSRRLARYALLTALAMALSWLESLVPLAGVVPPGVKLGLTNLVVIFALYRMGLRDAAAISLVRVVLVAFTFGNSYSFAYSLAGAALSLAVMVLLKRSGKFSLLGVSVAGGVSHNIAQVLVAMAVMETSRPSTVTTAQAPWPPGRSARYITAAASSRPRISSRSYRSFFILRPLVQIPPLVYTVYQEGCPGGPISAIIPAALYRRKENL